MLCLGVDPDLHDTAIASWDDAGPVAAHVVSVPRVKGRVENEAVLAMMQALSAPWPDLSRGATGMIGTYTLTDGGKTTKPIPFDGCGPDLPEWCAVEAQELRRGPGRQHSRPQDIVTLGQVAGMAVMRVARGYLHGCGLYFPKPSEWKGSVPKVAMQARLYDELCWGWERHGKGSGAYAVPQEMPASISFTVGFGLLWKHVGDAFLLARWCWEQANGRRWSR